MKKMRRGFLIITIIVAGIVSFTSCESDCTIDPENTCDIPIEIKKDETTVFIRFRVPEGNKTKEFTLSGTLFSYVEFQSVETVYFSHDDTGFVGNIKKFILKSAGEPVPGAEVFVEQEPNEEPIASTTTNEKGTFKIVFDKILNAGTYTVRASPANNDKSGFAIGGYRLD